MWIVYTIVWTPHVDQPPSPIDMLVFVLVLLFIVNCVVHQCVRVYASIYYVCKWHLTGHRMKQYNL